MPKVTLVEPQKLSKGQSASGRKSIKRFNVYLDDKFAFGADEGLVVDFRLVPGKIINEKDLEKLLFEAQIGKLMARIYGIFSIRQRSEKEIRDYFRVKNQESRIKGREEISELIIENLIEKLKQKGFVNDLAFAKAWVESRSKKKGIIALKSELIQKGVDKEIIDQVLEENVVDEEKIAKVILEKKLKSFEKFDLLMRKQKAVQFLLRQGFGYSIAKKVAKKVVK